MFGITTIETVLLALCLAGTASALIGRFTGLLSTREALLVLVIALAVPVVGSVICLALVVMAWHHRRWPLSAPTAWTPSANSRPCRSCPDQEGPVTP